jgi:glucose-6-phosphate dehydrogenase assembly protein OpcA
VGEPCDMVWSAEGTTPAEVESALSAMLVQRHSEHASCIPARTLNLVCIVDARSRAELVERLGRLGGYHASRTIVCSVEPRRTVISALARIGSDMHPGPGELAVLRETVVLALGERHLTQLESIVDPLVVADLPTVVWSPAGYDDVVRALLGLSQVVLLDSVDEPVPIEAMRRARRWQEHARVVDLAWVRTAPWRERLAATFDPPPLRPDLRKIRGVTVRHHAGSAVAALLLVGWLAERLGWRLSPLAQGDRQREGVASAPGGDLRIVLSPSPRQRVQGLAGMTLETASGRTLSLDRAPGGLLAREREHGGEQRTWTLLGASRGESGILGEAIRQALMPERLYGPAVAAAYTLAADR